MSETEFSDSTSVTSVSSASTPQISGSILSAPSISVKYSRMVSVGLYLQEGKDINYASLDRVDDIISHMPEKARRTLLAPIEQGLIDPQSVFYLIDDQRQGQIAVCVEDFVQLAATYSEKERMKEGMQKESDETVMNTVRAGNCGYKAHRGVDSAPLVI
jgi:hypothetical protein